MLHGYKKSKYNIYDNLEFLGLNPYEQKHFCFGEGGGDGDTGGVDEGEPTSQEAQDEQDEAEGKGISSISDETEATNLAGLIDQLDMQNNLGALDTGYQGISAQDKAEGLQSAMDRGDIGYNQAVEAGFVDHVEQAQREAELNLAIDIAEKYGLDPSQVQPGFMADPTLGPQTISYRGPGSLKGGATEVAGAAAQLAANIVDMVPGPIGIAKGLAGLGRQDSFAGLVGQARGQSRAEQSPSLASRVESYMDNLAAPQKEANMAARGETVATPETLSEQVAAVPEGYNPAIGMADPAFEGRAGVSYTGSPFSGLPTESFENYANALAGLKEAEAASPSQPQSSVDYFDALIDTIPTPSPAKDFYGDILDSDEIIPRIIAKTPTATPVVEEEVDIAVATPRTRTPATDTFSILANTYGPEVAAQLLPNRIV